MNKSLKKKNGFTLIEVLVVIGIIAVLAAVVLIAINPARQFRQARDSQRVSNINAILNAIGQYIADNKGEIPTEITLTKEDIDNDEANLCSVLVPKYLPSLPFDPGATVVNCLTTAYDTNYAVQKDVNGRVTIFADGEEPAGIDNITVTR